MINIKVNELFCICLFSIFVFFDTKFYVGVYFALVVHLTSDLAMFQVLSGHMRLLATTLDRTDLRKGKRSNYVVDRSFGRLFLTP